MAPRDLIGQRLDEFGVHRAGGDSHMVAFGGEMKSRPDEGAKRKGAENGDQPGVAQEHPHPASHHMFERADTHGVTVTR